MADWQRNLELRDVYHAGKPIPELASIVARRLRKVTVPGNDTHLEDERDLIAENFEELSKEEAATAEDFDEVMAELYDWADTPLSDTWPRKKLCWVKTR